MTPRPRYQLIPILVIAASAAFGNWNDTPVGIDLAKLRQFPLLKIRTGLLLAGSRVTFDGITAAALPAPAHEAVLRGVGKAGRPWEAHVAGLDEVWSADLDGNGTGDYVFFQSGPYGNGRTAPQFSLSILLMDREAMPAPFFTVVYRGENGEGIRHLVDLNHDGHAELLISTYDENASDARVGPFCSGHWTTQLYRFVNLSVEEMQVTLGGYRFPLLHDWTYRGTVCPELEKPFLPVQPAVLYEHGTAVAPEAINPAAGCQAVSPTVIVYDRPQIREIAFPNPFSTYPEDLAARIRRDGARVELRGINRTDKGGCSVNLMWAN